MGCSVGTGNDTSVRIMAYFLILLVDVYIDNGMPR